MTTKNNNTGKEISIYYANADKYYVISYSFGGNTEYWNSSLIADGFSAKNIDGAEGFQTEEEAQEILDEKVKPYAESKGWKVSFSIDEI